MSSSQQHRQQQHRPAEGPGPVQTLAQAYFRAHGRTQSEHISAYTQHPQYAPATRPAAAPSSYADDLADRLSRLGHSSGSGTSGGRPNNSSAPSFPSPPSPIKPLPSLPPARTPSQHRHQQQNQLPYMTHRPALSASSLGNIAERPPPQLAPPRTAPVHNTTSAPPFTFPEPSRPSHQIAYLPHPDPRASIGMMGLAQRQPLPRPPVQFPDPRAHMPPSAQFTPPRQPAYLPHQSQSAAARIEIPSQHLPPRSSPARPERLGGYISSSSPTSSPGRPYPVQNRISPNRPVPSHHNPAQTSYFPSTSASNPRPALRPERPPASASSSEVLLSSSSGASSPSRTGLREALPPPLPGQCWGIKRDGTRCTRKVGKGGKDKPSASAPTSTPKKGAAARPTRSAGSSPANAAGIQRKKTGASRGRPIILFDSEDEDDDDEDDWATSDRGRASPSRPAHSARQHQHSSSNLLLPPGNQRRHRRSRSAGNDPLPHLRVGASNWQNNGAVSSSEDDEDVEPRLLEPSYCFQHISEINKSPGFYLPHHHHHRGGGGNSPSTRRADVDAYVSFAEYLCAPDGRELGAQTQASLRSVMSAPLSVADVSGGERRGSAEEGGGRMAGRGRGYMYMYELRDFSTTAEVCLKVGRTSNVFRRMGEWRGRCRRRGAGLVLVGFEPSPQASARTHNNNRNGNNTSSSSSPALPPAQGVLGGAAEVWCDGIYGSNKWERLIHLELLDLGRRLDEGPCEDCGARHREIFLIPRRGLYRSDDGRGRGRGADDGEAIELVRGVVRKWEGFVRRLVDELE
ncbi:hypothetical protein CF319_g3248 [Tilletia indica]|nr:hypothetical protein CF319_g3248 [Tilletia indica]